MNPLIHPLPQNQDQFQIQQCLTVTTDDTRVVTADGMTASYTFEQMQTASKNHNDSNGEEFELRLLFISSEKGFLLSGIQSSEIPAELLDSALTVLTNSTEIAREACDMPISPLSRSVVVEIDRDMLELLPERQTVVSWLGPDVDLKQTIIPKETQLPG